MGSSNSNTVAQSIQWAGLMTQNRPLVLQGTQDPALTCANLVTQAILAPPFKWAWNRNTAVFQTIDPSGWAANFTAASGYRIIDNNGNMQTVTAAGITGPTQPVFNQSVGGNTTDNSVTWTCSLVSDYVQAIPDFGFIEQASVTDPKGKVWDIPNKTLTLTTNSDPGRWQSIAPYDDDNNGNITFRASPGIPDQLYTARIVYQSRAAIIMNTSSQWPIPDMFSQIYNTGFLGLIWLFSDDPRSAFMLQRFAAQVIAVSDGLTDQEKNSFLDQWDVMGASRRAASRTNQGTGARGAS